MARRCSACTAHVEPILDADSDNLIESTPGEIELGASAALSIKAVGAVAKAE
jgi:hypothetical protein